MDEIKLWRTGAERGLQSLDTVAQLETELQLEDILTAHPELLETDLQLVGRQTPAAGGWLDLLGVDRDGRLVIYELKRGALGRDAVTQVLDYASALTEMDLDALARHISARSGEGGVQQISDFTGWYEDRFGSDLQQLLPPRMVLVGLGIDETALRIARFINDGPHDIEVVTFYGFRDREGTLLARQLPVQRDEPSARRSTSAPLSIEQRRTQLERHLDDCGLRTRFEAVRDALLEQMPTDVFEDALSNGVGLKLTVRDHKGVRRRPTYFGVSAAYPSPGVVAISLGTITEQQHKADYAKLASRVQLSDWQHGGKAIVIESDDRWEQIKPHICEFAAAVHNAWQTYRNTPLPSE